MMVTPNVHPAQKFHVDYKVIYRPSLPFRFIYCLTYINYVWT